MNCERCGKPNAHFTGYCDPENGPSALDCENVPENLPFGKGYLCEDCLNEWDAQEHARVSALIDAHNARQHDEHEHSDCPCCQAAEPGIEFFCPDTIKGD